MPMNQSNGFQDMLYSLLNNSPFGMAYGGFAGHPMLGGQKGQAMQNSGMQQGAGMNALQSPSFTQVPQQGNWWSGSGPSVMTSSPFTGGQQNMMNQAGQMGLQGLMSGNMPGGFNFDPIAQKAQTQFQTQTIPSIAERFTALGGGQRSSAFQGALGQAGAGLNENLAALKSQYNMQMMPMLMQLLGMGLKPQYEQQYMPGTPGFAQTLAGGVAQAVPYAAMAFI